MDHLGDFRHGALQHQGQLIIENLLCLLQVVGIRERQLLAALGALPLSDPEGLDDPHQLVGIAALHTELKGLLLLLG